MIFWITLILSIALSLFFVCVVFLLTIDFDKLNTIALFLTIGAAILFISFVIIPKVSDLESENRIEKLTQIEMMQNEISKLKESEKELAKLRYNKELRSIQFDVKISPTKAYRQTILKLKPYKLDKF